MMLATGPGGAAWPVLARPGPRPGPGDRPDAGTGPVDDDAARLVAAALLCLVAVLAGLCCGFAGAFVPRATGWWFWGLDQWGEYLVQLPRWITLGAVGCGADAGSVRLSEHRRRDWRRGIGCDRAFR